MRAVKLSGKGEALVSIVVIFLDEERFIEEAIESVFAQTYGNWELLLVDDGSSDGSTEIALRYAERHPGKVRYLQHSGHRNRGMSASRNLGIRHAEGEYIAFLDADDVWMPEKQKQQAAILDERPQAGVVVGRSKYWHGWTGNPEDSRRDSIPRFSVRSNSLVKPPALVKLFYPLGTGPAPCPSSLLVRREVIEDTGGFEEDFQGIYSMYEDQAFLAKVYLRTAVFVAGQCWDKYREHPDSCTATVTRTGQYFCARFFLKWLTTYFVEKGIEDTESWLALQEALEQCSYLATLEEGVEIVDIVFPETDCKPLLGYRIETPQPGSWINNYAVDISGWVLGRGGLTADVEVMRDGIVLKRVPTDIPRPDIAAAFPEVSGAEQSGFHTTIGVPVVTEWELEVRALLRDQSSVPLGIVQGHCR
jgi:glycosyltransferase involved in cell wall biosynthesis